MKMFLHFSVTGFANTYLIGPSEGGDGILIDPGVFDVELLQLIEKNNLYIKHVLFTHHHESHVQGAQTLQKVYNAELYGGFPELMGHTVNRLDDNQKFSLGDFTFETILVGGHSSDSIVYRMNNMLFTGDVLGSGRIGSTNTPFAKDLLIAGIQDKLYTLPDTLLVMPGHGPPSTLAVEKKFNIDMPN